MRFNSDENPYLISLSAADQIQPKIFEMILLGANYNPCVCTVHLKRYSIDIESYHAGDVISISKYKAEN